VCSYACLLSSWPRVTCCTAGSERRSKPCKACQCAPRGIWGIRESCRDVPAYAGVAVGACGEEVRSSNMPVNPDRAARHTHSERQELTRLGSQLAALSRKRMNGEVRSGFNVAPLSLHPRNSSQPTAAGLGPSASGCFRDPSAFFVLRRVVHSHTHRAKRIDCAKPACGLCGGRGVGGNDICSARLVSAMAPLTAPVRVFETLTLPSRIQTFTLSGPMLLGSGSGAMISEHGWDLARKREFLRQP
jgi:hypothetical protein